MAIAAVAVMFSSTKTVHCSEMQGVDSIEQFMENHNKAWEGAGYSTQPSPPDTAQQSGSTNNGNTQPSASESEAKQEPKKVVKACEHVYTDTIIKEPTCAEDGKMESKCSKCGDTYETVITATGEHTYSSEVTKEATCKETGEMTYTCSVCEDTYNEEIPVVDHKYEESVTKEATCTEAGEKTFTCIMCGDAYTEDIPAIGHQEAEPVTTKKAGLFKKGEEVVKCSACGEILETRVISSKYPISYSRTGCSFCSCSNWYYNHKEKNTKR